MARKRYTQYGTIADSLRFYRDKPDGWLERKIGTSMAKALSANRILTDRGKNQLTPKAVELLFELFQQFTPRREDAKEED